jgi:hypothetical protein
MDEIKQSGDTTSIPLEKPTMRGYIDTEGVLYATVESIAEETFDEEMDTYDFIVHTYSGDLINVRLKEKHIHQMMLYMRKEQADLRHLKHIMKN